ncbi:MAG TPA: hypothetical protein VHZ55_19535 [Bryobacteraceae bacterium]|nr:hypothetical protein [Bryobacteraceae bacterium]
MPDQPEFVMTTDEIFNQLCPATASGFATAPGAFRVVGVFRK